MELPAAQYDILFQLEYVLLAVVAFSSTGSHRDRSAISILLIWAAWTLLTDQFNLDISGIILSYESVFFSVLVLWILARPYSYISDIPNEDYVSIAFYQGRKAPIVSELSALIGLPFSSISIVVGEFVLRPSKGILRMGESRALKQSDYVFVNTKIPVNRNVFNAIRKQAGAPIKLGSGCVAAMAETLKVIGLPLKTWTDNIPSLFYYRVVKWSRPNAG